MAQEENRLLFFDNLRTFIILLVVMYHAGWVYEKSGLLSSVWIVDDPAKNDLAGMLNLITDMGGLSVYLCNAAIPSVTKYFILIVSTYAASNFIVFLYYKTVQRI